MDLVIHTPRTIARVIESRTVVVEFTQKTAMQDILKSSYHSQRISNFLFKASDILASPITIALGIIPCLATIFSGIEYLEFKDLVVYYEKFIKNPEVIKFKGIFDQNYYQKKYDTCLKNKVSVLTFFKISLITTITLTVLFILGLICEVVAISLRSSVDAKIKNILGTRDDILKQLDIEPKSIALADSFFFYDDEIVAKAIEKDFSNIEVLPKEIAKQLLLAMCREDITYDQKIPEYLKSDFSFMEQIREIRHPLEIDA